MDQGKPTTGPGIQEQVGAGKAQLGGWLTFNWFFFTHFDMRMDLILRQETPTTFLSQLHYYF
jgi:hypothetical protein